MTRYKVDGSNVQSSYPSTGKAPSVSTILACPPEIAQCEIVPADGIRAPPSCRSMNDITRMESGSQASENNNMFMPMMHNRYAFEIELPYAQYSYQSTAVK